jgi:hypothetical protein
MVVNRFYPKQIKRNHFKEFKINGQKLTIKNGVVYIDEKPINFDQKNLEFATKLELSKAIESLNTEPTKQIDESVFVKSKDLNKIKKEIAQEVFENAKNLTKNYSEIPLKKIQKQIDEIKENTIKSKIQKKLIKEFSVFDQVEAVIDAFLGKPQKLEKIKKRVLEIRSE